MVRFFLLFKFFFFHLFFVFGIYFRWSNKKIFFRQEHAFGHTKVDLYIEIHRNHKWPYIVGLLPINRCCQMLIF